MCSVSYREKVAGLDEVSVSLRTRIASEHRGPENTELEKIMGYLCSTAAELEPEFSPGGIFYPEASRREQDN